MKRPVNLHYFSRLIKKTRSSLLNESGTAFGKRFGVSHSAVSDWENGKSEAGWDVLYYCLVKNNIIQPLEDQLMTNTQDRELPANRFTDTNAWKDSADPVERMCYWINYLSPHNLWRAKEALQQFCIEAEAHMTKIGKSLPQDRELPQELVQEIMQAGFDVAMGGNPFNSEEENEQEQNRQYDAKVKKYAKLIEQRLASATATEREWIEKVIARHVAWKPTEGYKSEEEHGFQKGLMAEARLFAKDLREVIGGYNQ